MRFEGATEEALLEAAVRKLCKPSRLLVRLVNSRRYQPQHVALKSYPLTFKGLKGQLSIFMLDIFNYYCLYF
jgi:hypothetical protein